MSTPPGFTVREKFQGTPHRLGVAPAPQQPNYSVAIKCNRVFSSLSYILLFASCTVGILGLGGTIDLNPMAKIALGISVPLSVFAFLNLAIYCFVPSPNAIMHRMKIFCELCASLAIVGLAISVLYGSRVTPDQLGKVMLIPILSLFCFTSCFFCQSGMESADAALFQLVSRLGN